MAFHESMGFIKMADFPNMGHKFGRWLGVRYYRKNLRLPNPSGETKELIPQEKQQML
jgi:hypothetical protein